MGCWLSTTLVSCWLSLQWLEQEECERFFAGQVIDSHRGQPIASALVAWEHAGISLYTDQHGKFEIAKRCETTAYITISKAGFQQATYSLTHGKEFVLLLTPETIELEPITITGEKIAIGQASAVTTPIPEEVLIQRQGKGLAEALSYASGVQILRTGSSIAKPVIQGLHSNRILVLNNGIRQEGQQWGLEHAPEMDAFLASELKVIKGAATVQYGPEAMGGVVIVKPPALPTKKGISSQWHLQGASNGKQGIFSGQVSGYHKGIGWRLQATGKRSGNIRTPNYFLANTGVAELNFSLAAGYQKEKYGVEVFFSRFATQLGIFRGAHIGNLTDLQFALSSPRPLVEAQFSYQIDNPRQRVIHHLFKVNGYRKHEISQWEYQYAFQHNQRQEFDIRRAGRDKIPAMNLNLFTHLLELNYQTSKGKHWQWKGGVSGLAQSNLNVPGTGIRPLVPNYWVTAAGAFALLKYSVPRWDLETGLRYDWRHLEVRRFDRNGILQRTQRWFSNFSATVGVAYHWSESIVLRTQMASAWRPPSANELYSEGLHHSAAALEFGSDSLKSEQSGKWTVGIHAKTSTATLEVTGFAQYIGNYIYLAPQGETRLTIRGAFPVFHFEQTQAALWGSDILLHWQPFQVWSVLLKGAITRAKDLTNNAFLPWIPPEQLSISLQGHIPLPAQSRWKNGYIALTNLLVARQWRTPPERDFAPPPHGYWVSTLDAGVCYRKEKNTLFIGLTVYNLANTTYRDYMNRFRYFADEQGRNFQLYLRYITHSP
ncbi:MAG: TonB-dependent receptor [Cytophagales bacterium]|nr:TonB-dependent receptor [Bernardetiaceae bacterium]MDW8209461.1 TonB-dependent receptor [Cytophagales bacterium]